MVGSEDLWRVSDFLFGRVWLRQQAPDDVVGTLEYPTTDAGDCVAGQEIWANGGSLFS